ncbi:MAG: hypothetical protein HFH59_13510 [Lachnospiraceae bacterium]|nr:hypothetical protein [Lachnospiraceae bacterium]
MQFHKSFSCPAGVKTNYHYYRKQHCGGPDGEINASLRYLSQRFTAANRVCMGVLNDIGTEASEMFPGTFPARKLFLTNIRAEDILCL